MSKFYDVLVDDIQDIETLPLLHTCDAFTLRQILIDMELVPQLCDVFSLDLLYTYYGIPSYRSNYKLATTNPAFFMICLILDSDSITGLHKAFPFDSGAFEKRPEMKEEYFHPQQKIIDFELENSIGSAKKVIKTFYETNQNYLSQKPKLTKEFSQIDFEALSYKNLIQQKANSHIDDRSSSIEMIFNKSIPLNSKTVKQLIIPNVFKDDEKVMEIIKTNFNIQEPIGYDTFRGSPNESFGLIRSEYFKYLNN